LGKNKLCKLPNKEIAKRNLLIHPPEPPLEILAKDPTNSIYVGRTEIFHAPFYWTYEDVSNPHIAIVGISGSGKSYFIKTFLMRASFVWESNALIIDWAGEYKDWYARRTGRLFRSARDRT